MKKYLLFVLLTFWLVGCTDSSPKNIDPTDASQTLNSNESDKTSKSPISNINDYFPLKENITYVYECAELPLANYKMINSHIKDNKIQRLLIGTEEKSVTTYVISLDKDKATLIYSDLSNYFFRNDLDKKSNDEVIILEAPLELNKTYNPDPSTTAKITAVDLDVSVKAGDYKAIEITSKTVREGKEQNSSYELKEIVTELASIIENEPFKSSIDIYYPLTDEKNYGKFVSINKEFDFNTNDNGYSVLENVLKQSLTNEDDKLLFQQNAKINLAEPVFVEQDGKITDNYFHLDLSKEYVSEMNLGSGYEKDYIQALANTVCQYTRHQKLKLTLDGKNLETGHITFSDDEFLTFHNEDEAEVEPEVEDSDPKEIKTEEIKTEEIKTKEIKENE